MTINIQARSQVYVNASSRFDELVPPADAS